MPALIAFGRRWNIASDDFVFPGFLESFIRFFWFLIMLILQSLYNFKLCEGERYFKAFAFLLILNFFTILVCILLVIEAGKGTILEVEKRKNVSKLLYIKMVLFISEGICTGVASVFLFIDRRNGSCNAKIIILVALILEAILLFVFAVGVLLVFSKHGNKNLDYYATENKKTLRQILKYLRLASDHEINNALDEVADILTAFFLDNDFVISDILAGLVLFLNNSDTKESSYEIIENNEVPEWMEIIHINRTNRFTKFALAVYGWTTFIALNSNKKLIWQFIKKVNCCPKKENDFENEEEEENKSLLNVKAFMTLTGIRREDLLFVSFENMVFQIPFIVCLDHQTNSIVIAIRGSASIHDFVTDLSLHEDVIMLDVDSDKTIEGDEMKVKAHKGMLLVAKNILTKLDNSQILDKTFFDYPSYDLVITGHSLGGGVGALLTLLLKQKYSRNIKCYSISPPGCVLDNEGRKYLKDSVLSIIVGEDIVPRMSYHSLFKLKCAIEEELYRTRMKKYEILTKGIFKLFVKKERIDINGLNYERRNNIPFYNDNIEEGSIPSDDFIEEPITETRINMRHTTYQADRTKLLPPGQLFHIQFDKETAHWRWITPECLSEIHLNARVALDHFPYAVVNALQQIMEQSQSSTFPSESSTSQNLI
ncbi:Sn1-specific diacylglycerol lipase beta [Strongyloides ratti]|uniref:sn-1-specific diacylglycerol lipase n=1 Tax=Strongyloides ratti TaxID=34506 RepID=A0A090L6Z8_STRRB|nr:Sn1-specific diacylglycerol lipase beta [Strongyloides ratti]CEF63898.1 Sn1-specific diacylglycerol lipase beta [Strongyloides ratti]